MKGLEKKFGAPPITEEDVSGGGSLGAAKDVLEAIKDGDASALDAALKLHYEHCKEGGDEEAEEADGAEV